MFFAILTLLLTTFHHQSLALTSINSLPSHLTIQLADDNSTSENGNIAGDGKAMIFQIAQTNDSDTSDFDIVGRPRRIIVKLPESSTTINNNSSSTVTLGTTKSVSLLEALVLKENKTTTVTTPRKGNETTTTPVDDRGLLLFKPVATRPPNNNRVGSTLLPSDGQFFWADVPDSMLADISNNNKKRKDDSDTSDNGLSAGVIGGIAGGCSGAVVISIIVLIIIACRTNKLKKQLAAAQVLQANGYPAIIVSQPGRRNKQTSYPIGQGGVGDSSPQRRHRRNRGHGGGGRPHRHHRQPSPSERGGGTVIEPTAPALLPHQPAYNYNFVHLPINAGRRLGAGAIRPVTLTTPLSQSRATAAAILNTNNNNNHQSVSSTYASGSFVAMLPE